MSNKPRNKRRPQKFKSMYLNCGMIANRIALSPKWSFVRDIRTSFVTNVGIFRCRQTGELMEMNYKYTVSGYPKY